MTLFRALWVPPLIWQLTFKNISYYFGDSTACVSRTLLTFHACVLWYERMNELTLLLVLNCGCADFGLSFAQKGELLDYLRKVSQSVEVYCNVTSNKLKDMLSRERTTSHYHSLSLNYFRASLRVLNFISDRLFSCPTHFSLPTAPPTFLLPPAPPLFPPPIKVGSFDETSTQFYSAEIIIALEYLHAKGIIHR